MIDLVWRFLWRGAPMVLLVGLLGFASSGVRGVVGDIVMDRRSTANHINPVLFSHWRHRTQFKCYACHPDPFEMRAEANDISMDNLGAGEYCARCHNGRIAFSVGFDSCRTCHAQPAP